MKEKQVWAYAEIARICRELAVLLHAGVQLSDGLALLAQEESGRMRDVLRELGCHMDEGAPLAQALETAGGFPAHVSGMVAVGERAGRTEQALQALAYYYEQRERQAERIRAALTYPAILLLMMLVVIVVLLARVLPVFDEVYASLGGQLTGVAGGLLLVGHALDAAMPVLCVLLAAVLVLVAVVALNNRVRDSMLALWRKKFGDRGVARKLNNARFAQGLAMGMGSGLPPEEAVELCAALLADVPAAAYRCKDCAARLAEGDDLTQVLQQSKMLPASACRLLTLGLRGGSGDAVMDEIARRMSEEAEQALEHRVAQVEPTLVLATSLLVGVILLSVMLPLMHIMSAIG